MGFFSDLFEVSHRAIAKKAADYCMNSELSQYEQSVISKNSFRKDEFTRLRNIYTIKMFIGLFQALEAKMPNSHYRIANMCFQQHYSDYYFNSGVESGWAMWDDSAEGFAQNV